MSKKDIYKITIKNWEKYNKNLKAGHKKILISVGFLSDAKIRSLTPTGRLLFLSCLLLAGESTQSQFEVSHESLVFQSGVKSGSLQSHLAQLQSLQLVTFTKIESLNNRKEEKRREKKGSEENRIEISSMVKKPMLAVFDFDDNKKSDPEINKRVKKTYVEAYQKRYKVQPVINARFNSNISQLVKRLGEDDAIKVVEFYLNHNDGFYLKTTHSISICLRDCESLRTQMLRNKPITSNDVKNFEKTDHFKSQIDRIARGEI